MKMNKKRSNRDLDLWHLHTSIHTYTHRDTDTHAHNRYTDTYLNIVALHEENFRRHVIGRPRHLLGSRLI